MGKYRIASTRINFLRHLIRQKHTSHPSDGVKCKTPPIDDKTEWVSPLITEYFQIRKRMRMESDQYFNDCHLAAIEHRFRTELTQVITTKGKLDPATELYRKKLFGEDSAKNKNVFSEKHIFRFPMLGKNDPELSVKVYRQLVHLMPYIGSECKNPTDFETEVKSSVFATNFRGRHRLDRHNERLLKEQEALLKKFDEETSGLVEEMSAVKSKIFKEEKLLDSDVQLSLKKWYTLKIDFSNNIGEGRILENVEELDKEEKDEETKEHQSEQYDDSEDLEEVDGEEVSRVQETSTFLEIKEKVEKETLYASKEHISKEEALDLLSDESVLNLVESMRMALQESHKLLQQTFTDDDEKQTKAFIEGITTSEIHKSEKEIYLESIRMNRYLDHSVRVRDSLTDENATKEQRLVRTLYDNTKSALFKEKKDHILMIPAHKEDYPYLKDLPITRHTKSYITPGSDRKEHDGRVRERAVTLKVPLTAFECAEKLKILFPDMVDPKTQNFVVTATSCSTKQENQRMAFLLLSKTIHEATNLTKVGDVKNLKEYEAKFKELNLREYEEIRQVSKIDSDRFRAERAKAVERNRLKVRNHLENVFEVVSQAEGKETAIAKINEVLQNPLREELREILKNVVVEKSM